MYVNVDTIAFMLAYFGVGALCHWVVRKTNVFGKTEEGDVLLTFMCFWPCLLLILLGMSLKQWWDER